MMAIIHHVTGRQLPGPAPVYNRFNALQRAGVATVIRPKAFVVSGDYATWRGKVYEAINEEAGEWFEHPQDTRLGEGHCWLEGDRVCFGLMGKVQVVTIKEAYEVGNRLRYKIEWKNGWWVAITQRQLIKLMKRAASEFRTQVKDAQIPPEPPIGITTAIGALPPLKWVAQHPLMGN